jgi:addiction module HigA family antidote
MKEKKMAPVHPGEILQKQFLEPLEMSQNRLATQIGVAARRINEIVHGKRRITADTAMRLARFFNMTPQYWLGLQADYDLDVVQDELEEKINRTVHPYRAGHYVAKSA